MREILFRAKRTDKDNGEWVYGSYCSKKTGITRGEQFVEETKHIIIINMTGSGYTYAPVDPETVGQYTGLTDKSGRKIFEGDICKDGDNTVRILWNDKHQWGVEMSRTDNVLSRGLIFPLWQYDKCEENGNRELEVISNIFDNPELMKG